MFSLRTVARLLIVAALGWGAFCILSAWTLANSIEANTSTNVAWVGATRALLAGFGGSVSLLWTAIALRWLVEGWKRSRSLFLLRVLVFASLVWMLITLALWLVKIPEIWTASTAYEASSARISATNILILLTAGPLAAALSSWAAAWVLSASPRERGGDPIGGAKKALWLLTVVAGASIGVSTIAYLVTVAVPRPKGILISKSAHPPSGVVASGSRLDQPKVEEVDVSSAVRILNLSSCKFSSETESAFSRLLQFNEAAQDWKPIGDVSLGGMRLTPTVRVTAAEDVAPGGRVIESSIRFPAETIWNGLRITRLSAKHGDFPDIDDFDSRSVNFAEPPSRLAARLRGLGYRVPVEPDYLNLSTSEDVCGGSMQITRVSGGSALVCSWGC